jgi:hypothetical protein
MMETMDMLLSQRELAQRWNKPVASIDSFRVQGVGPRPIEISGDVMYPMHEVQRFERACLFFNPAEVAIANLA